MFIQIKSIQRDEMRGISSLWHQLSYWLVHASTSCCWYQVVIRTSAQLPCIASTDKYNSLNRQVIPAGQAGMCDQLGGWSAWCTIPPLTVVPATCYYGDLESWNYFSVSRHAIIGSSLDLFVCPMLYAWVTCMVLSTSCIIWLTLVISCIAFSVDFLIMNISNHDIFSSGFIVN